MIEALYIHIPFCEAKCNYCDFISFPQCSELTKANYIEKLEKEALLIKDNLEINLKSIFIGGGTPTCLTGGLLARLLLFIRENFQAQSLVEFSIEANPGTVDKSKLHLLKDNGVNRISFGVQTFDRQLLKTLGRIHTPEEVNKSFFLAREVGFGNINLDLMYGLPGQTLNQWENSLKKALELNPEHISLYQLKIEEDTPLSKQLITGEIGEFPDGLAVEMYQLAKECLIKSGYEHYEISNYAKPGFRCIHNQTYWLTKPYLGLGAGAHSFLPPIRKANTGVLEDYFCFLEKGKILPSDEEFLDKQTAMSEFMFMALRLIDGVDLKVFKDRFGYDALVVFKEAIDKCRALNLVELVENKLRLTEKGILLGNLVFEEFLL